MQIYNDTIDKCREEVSQDYVFCKGWSPKEGPFARVMRRRGYGSYWVADALAHPDSGCKNVSMRKLSDREIETKATEIFCERKAIDDRLKNAARIDADRRTEKIAEDSPETPIGSVIWEYHTPAMVHTVIGAPGLSPRWVRQLAAKHWPEAHGIKTVRVRVECTLTHDFTPAEGVTKILLDLAPDRMGIDATTIGGSNCWES